MPVYVSMVTMQREEGGRVGEMSALALPASTGKGCSQLLPHRVLRANHTGSSMLGFLGVGGSLSV